MTLAQHTDRSGNISAYGSYASNVGVKATSLSLHRYTWILLVTDATLLLLTGMAPITMYPGIDPTAMPRYVSTVLIAMLVFELIAHASKSYQIDRILEWRRTIRKSVLALLVMFSTLVLIAIATNSIDLYSRVWFGSWVLSSLALMVLARAVLLASAEAKLAKGLCLQRALIVSCTSNVIADIKLSLEADNRIRVVGALTAPGIGAVPDLLPYVRQLKPEVIVLNLGWAQLEHVSREFGWLSQYAIEVLVLPEPPVGMQKTLRVRRVGRQSLLQIMEPPLAAWDREIKRAEDLIVASLALLIVSPLMLLTALAIKLDSKGPVLFKQVRVGYNGELIEVWKFRSMYVEATDRDAKRQTSKNDPRITRIGRFIRRTSIDELPQFWNVLQGRMSVVGPRPHALMTYADGEPLEAIVSGYQARHRVKPGITGWAQVNGSRGELSSRDQVKRRLDYDLHYIESWSVLLDMKIILMTAVRMIHDPRAY